MQTITAAACARYVGPVDERQFGDSKDYECGEVPIGQTHPGLFQETGGGVMVGSPDENWKGLAEFDLWDSTAFVKIGRLPKQRAFTFATLDLTTGGTRNVNAPASVAAQNVWLALHPEQIQVEGQSRDALLVDACVYLPGNEIDAGSVTYNPADRVFALVQRIDFGGATVASIELCALIRVYLDDSYNPLLNWLDIYHLDMPITDLDPLDIEWGPGVIAGAALVPVVDEIVRVAMLQVEIVEAAIGAGGGEDTANFLLDAYSVKIIENIEPKVERALKDALNELKINPRLALQAVCAQLDPKVLPSHPYFYFYRFLRAHCDGFTSSHVMRPFQTNEASVEAGCYEHGGYITPADAGKNRWWASYTGQEWAFPFWPDGGCRLGASVRSNLEESAWPTLVCAAMTFNAWLNNGPQPPQASLRNMVSANCTATGRRALQDYYGDGRDLIELYQTIHGLGGELPLHD